MVDKHQLPLAGVCLQTLRSCDLAQKYHRNQQIMKKTLQKILLTLHLHVVWCCKFAVCALHTFLGLAGISGIGGKAAPSIKAALILSTHLISMWNLTCLSYFYL